MTTPRVGWPTELLYVASKGGQESWPDQRELGAKRQDSDLAKWQGIHTSRTLQICEITFASEKFGHIFTSIATARLQACQT